MSALHATIHVVRGEAGISVNMELPADWEGGKRQVVKLATTYLAGLFRKPVELEPGDQFYLTISAYRPYADPLYAGPLLEYQVQHVLRPAPGVQFGLRIRARK